MSMPFTVLVVEDEILILVDLADRLRSCGYNVIECLDALQAIAVLAAGTPTDLVFSDIQIPGQFDGLDLAHWISRHRPDVRIIMTSGDPESLTKAAENAGLPTVSKPYAHHDLIELFRSFFPAPPDAALGSAE